MKPKRSSPSLVRLTPELLKEFQSLLPNGSPQPAEGSLQVVLLFGTTLDRNLTVKAARYIASRELERPLPALVSDAQRDPGLASFELVGWCGVRPTRGLEARDLQFHNRRFRRLSDVALLLIPQDQTGFDVELYSRASPGPLSDTNQSVSSARINSPVAEVPLDLKVHGRVSESFYMKVYQLEDLEAQETRNRRWRAVLRWVAPWNRTVSVTEVPRTVPATDEPGTVPVNDESCAVPKTEAPLSVALEPADVRTIAKVEAPPRPPLPEPNLIETLPTLESSPVEVPGTVENPAGPAVAQAVEEEAAPPQITRTAPPSAVEAVEPLAPPPAADVSVASALPEPAPGGTAEAWEPVVSPLGADQAAPAPPHSVHDPAAGATKLSRGLRRSLWPLAIGLFMSGLTVGVAYFASLRGRSAATRNVLSRSDSQADELELNIAGQGERLLVTWDRTNPIVRSAVTGSLEIVDGEKHRVIALAPDQVRGGALIYRPASQDVLFRLNLRNAAGRTFTALVQSIDGALPVPTPERPKPPASEPLRTSALPDKPPRSAAAPVPQIPFRARVSKEVANSKLPLGTPRAVQRDLGRTSSEKRVEPVTANIPNQLQLSDHDSQTVPPAGVTPESPKPNANPLVSASNSVRSSSMRVSYAPPRPLRQVLPDLRGNGVKVYGDTEVAVLVQIDNTGRVTSVHLPLGQPGVNLSLAGAALKAAREWQFQPAVLGAQPVPGEYTIRFRFHPARN